MPRKPDDRQLGKKCLDSAYRLISRRDHSRAELARKLKERGFPEAQITWAVAQCLRYNYLDDDRFAHGHARHLQRRGYGIRRIRQSLRMKGLPGELIEQAVLQHCTDQAQLGQCRHLLRKKIKSMPIDHATQELKPKLYRYLLGRGFAPDIIAKVLDGALKNTPP